MKKLCSILTLILFLSSITGCSVTKTSSAKNDVVPPSNELSEKELEMELPPETTDTLTEENDGSEIDDGTFEIYVSFNEEGHFVQADGQAVASSKHSDNLGENGKILQNVKTGDIVYTYHPYLPLNDRYRYYQYADESEAIGKSTKYKEFLHDSDKGIPCIDIVGYLTSLGLDEDNITVGGGALDILAEPRHTPIPGSNATLKTRQSKRIMSLGGNVFYEIGDDDEYAFTFGQVVIFSAAAEPTCWATNEENGGENWNYIEFFGGDEFFYVLERAVENYLNDSAGLIS